VNEKHIVMIAAALLVFASTAAAEAMEDYVGDIAGDEEPLEAPAELPPADDGATTGRVDLTGLQTMAFAGAMGQNTANWAAMMPQAGMSSLAALDPKTMHMMAIVQLVLGLAQGAQSQDPQAVQQALTGALGTFMQADMIERQQEAEEEARDDQRLMAGIGAGSSLVGGVAGLALGGPVGGMVGMGLGNGAANTAMPFVMGKTVPAPGCYAEYPVQQARGGVGTATPIVLDLNHNGRADLTDGDWRADDLFDPRGSVEFDIDGDGRREFCEWMSPDADGLLVVDRGDDGVILGQRELFGDGEGFADGYQKLAAWFDKDGNGVVAGSELVGLKVWMDDGDAVAEPGELHELSELGITHLGIRHDGLQCWFTQDGHDFDTWDWVTEYIE